MSLIINKVKEVMQLGMKNMGADHSVPPHDIQIIISRKKDNLAEPCYQYCIDWKPQREVSMTDDLIRPTFGLDLMTREEISKQFIPKKLEYIARDYEVPNDENVKVIVTATTSDLKNILLIPYYGNEQLKKDGVPVTLPFDYIMEL